MPLSRKARIWIVVLATPFVLLVLAGIGLKLYFTSERLKGMILPQIEESTNRSVTIDEITLSLVPNLGVTIDGLRISNPAGTSFDRNEFLSFSRIEIAIKLLPILSNRFEIKNILIDRPVMYFEVNADGRKNYSSAPEPGTDTMRISTEGSATGDFLLANFELRDGEIEYVNKKFDSRMTLSGINQIASAEARIGEPTLQFHSRASIDKFSYGSIQAGYVKDLKLTSEGSVTIDGRKGSLMVDAVNIKINDIPLGLTGNMTELTAIPHMDFTISSPDVPMSQILSLIPPEKLKAASGLKSSGSARFTITMKGEFSDRNNPAVTGSFSLADGSLQYQSLPKSITNIQLVGAFEKPEAPVEATGIGEFGIDRFSASIGSSTLTGALHITNFTDPLLRASFRGSLDLNEVGELYPLDPGTELSGRMDGDVSVEGKARVSSSLRGSGSIVFHNVTIKTAGSPRPLRNLQGSISFNNDVIQSKSLAMKIGESDLGLSFVMKNYLGLVMSDTAKGKRASATLTLASKRLRTADLMEPDTSPEKEGSRAKQGQAAKSGGMLPGMDVAATVAIDRLETERFQFSNAKGSASVSNGIVTLKNFSLNAFDGTIKTKGTLDTRDLKKRPFNLDLEINDVQSNTMLPKFTSFGNYLFGKLSMTAKLKGDLNDTLGFERQSLIGGGTVKIADGKVDGLPLAASLAGFTGLQELKVVNFNQWANSFAIEGGRVKISDLKVNAGTTDFLVNGSQGLDGTLDYSLNLKLPASASDRLSLPGVADQLLQFFKDSEGRINLNFQVTGESASPSVKLDTKSQEEMAKKAVGDKISAEKKKLEDELKKKGEDALKKLLKRP